jgi:lysozyme family protein
MAEFLPAFERMIVNEGGYVLHTVKDDRGGATYAGIARNFHPGWQGWKFIDQGETPPADMVRQFYRSNFWHPLQLDDVAQQEVASNIFDFGVNAGISTAAKLAQLVAGTTPDGKIGRKTIEALNAIDPDLFVARYALAKIARYRDIVTKNRTQQRFLLGWLNRTLKGMV